MYVYADPSTSNTWSISWEVSGQVKEAAKTPTRHEPAEQHQERASKPKEDEGASRSIRKGGVDSETELFKRPERLDGEAKAPEMDGYREAPATPLRGPREALARPS